MANEPQEQGQGKTKKAFPISEDHRKAQEKERPEVVKVKTYPNASDWRK